MKSLLGTIVLLATASLSLPADAQRAGLFPQIKVETTQGEFVLRLDGRRAPISTGNFLQYVRSGHYDGTIFHRVIPGFMAQGGGFDKDITEKPGGQPIPNESGNGLSNRRGTIAMARTGDPHSATAQFFINLVDNARLDPSAGRWGYAVFGEVIEGMETLDKIAAIPTTGKGRFRTDVPETDVVITGMSLVAPEK